MPVLRRQGEHPWHPDLPGGPARQPGSGPRGWHTPPDRMSACSSDACRGPALHAQGAAPAAPSFDTPLARRALVHPPCSRRPRPTPPTPQVGKRHGSELKEQALVRVKEANINDIENSKVLIVAELDIVQAGTASVGQAAVKAEPGSAQPASPAPTATTGVKAEQVWNGVIGGPGRGSGVGRWPVALGSSRCRHFRLRVSGVGRLRRSCAAAAAIKP